MTQKREIWGTFAVDDHLRRRPFLAEVILFDRLVIPTPPAWTADALREWPASWNPKLLKDLIEVLGDHAIAMPWDQAKRERWQGAYSQYKEQRIKGRQADAVGTSWDVQIIRSSAQDTPAKYLTRAVISSIVEEADNELVNKIRRLPLLLSTQIETVVAYGSYHAFQEDAYWSNNPADKETEAEKGSGDALLLSWDFFVPEDPDLSDIEILAKVVRKLEVDQEFNEHRRAFNELRRRLSASGIDPLMARAEIEKRLAAYNRILQSISRLQMARTVLTYAAIAAPLADFLLPGLGSASGVALGLASQSWSNWAPNPQPGAGESAVAMVHDLREEFRR